jgi:serine/threonine protein kinase
MPPDSPDNTQVTQIIGISESTWDSLPQGAAIGRYIILSILGSGGMGVVYAAYDPDLDRKIAIKLIRPDRLNALPGDDKEHHLLHEARILARLSHPNLLPIFDIGHFGDQLFLSMEYIKGQTLWSWQKETRHHWQETIGYYLQAGAGLSAAHGAGIVHRDFKPQNIMLGDDGRVRVMDFGLSQTTAPLENAEPFQEQSGSLAGTPVYMSPEQLTSGITTAASDQFSFAVALFEALYGERPFSEKFPAALLEQIEKGDISLPAGNTVPGWIRQILLRALNADPDKRYADIDDLLSALQHDPAKRRKQWFAGIAAGIAIITTTALLYNRNSIQPCQDADTKFIGIWDDARKQQLEQRFLASRLPYAQSSFDKVSNLLNQYKNSWINTHTQACRVTHVTGEQSERLLDLRMLCLENKRQEAKALIDIFARADAELIPGTVKAAGSLPPISACTNIKSLSNLIDLPGDQQQRKAISNTNTLIAQSGAQAKTGHYPKSLSLAEQALQNAKIIGYPPLLAKASFQAATALKQLGESKKAEAQYQDAFTHAIEARDDLLAAKSATGQVWIVGHLQSRFRESETWGRYAEAFLSRMGNTPISRAQLFSNQGTVAQDQGHYEKALGKAEQVLELRRQALGDNHERVAVAMVNLANAHFHLNGPRKSIPYYRQAYEMYSRAVGKQHPTNVLILSNLASALSETGQLDEARQVITQALDLSKQTYGEEHFETALTAQTLAHIEMRLEQNEQSLSRYLSSLSIIEKQLGKTHPFVIDELTGIVSNLMTLKRFKEAIPYIKRGKRLTRELEEGQEFSLSLFLLAEAKIELYLHHSPAQAKRLAEDALQLAMLAGNRADYHKEAVHQFLETFSSPNQ